MFFLYRHACIQERVTRQKSEGDPHFSEEIRCFASLLCKDAEGELVYPPSPIGDRLTHHDLCLSHLPLIAVVVTLKLKRYYTYTKKPNGKE